MGIGRDGKLTGDGETLLVDVDFRVHVLTFVHLLLAREIIPEEASLNSSGWKDISA